MDAKQPFSDTPPLALGGRPRLGHTGNSGETGTAARSAIDQLCAELESDAMKGLWTVQGRPEVPSGLQPHVWRWKKVQEYLRRAGETMSLDDSVVRRALVFWNPGARDHWDATNTLTAAVQMMLPGENVVTHRHIHSALRFITHGSGATTTVNGGKVSLSEGDLVITPSWAWHDHANESSGPVIWMDGVDRPLVKMLDAVFFEVYPKAGYQPVTRTGDDATFQLDMDGLSASRFSPQLAYRWEDTWKTLSALRSAGDACPYDDISLVFRNPLNGGHITPTMGAAIQLLTPGRGTRAHRHTSSAVYHVFRGRGYSIINGHRYDWEQGDYFALPPRMWHEHANLSPSEDAILFSINDKPAYEALALYRDEGYVKNGGHQDVIAESHTSSSGVEQ